MTPMTQLDRRSALKLAAASFAAAMVPGVVAAQGTNLKFQIYKDSGGGFRWRLKSGNGQVIATSGQGYKAKADCKSAIDLIKRGAGSAVVEDAA